MQNSDPLAMQLNPQEHSTVCGARLPGGPCKAAPMEGKKRCHAHGGAPRSGAPAGNINALTHGTYVGGRDKLDEYDRGRARRMSVADRDRVPRLVRDAKVMAQTGVRPPYPGHKIFGPTWNGQGTREMFLKLKNVIAEQMLTAAHFGHLRCDESWAMRDVLDCLCRNEAWFESIERFADAICSLFSYLDDGKWPLPRAGTPDALTYYVGWRNFCAILYDWCCPDRGSEQRQRETQLKREMSLEKLNKLIQKLQALAQSR